MYHGLVVIFSARRPKDKARRPKTAEFLQPPSLLETERNTIFAVNVKLKTTNVNLENKRVKITECISLVRLEKLAKPSVTVALGFGSRFVCSRSSARMLFASSIFGRGQSTKSGLARPSRWGLFPRLFYVLPETIYNPLLLTNLKVFGPWKKQLSAPNGDSAAFTR